MSQIITPSQWTQQPQVPVEIDWGNPLTSGLVHAFTSGGKDLAGSGFFTHPNGVASAPTSNGVGNKYVAGSSQYATKDSALTGPPLTLFALHRPESTSTAAVISTGTASSTNRVVVFFGSAANAYNASGSGGAVSATATVAQNTLHAVALTVDAAAAGLIYLDGSYQGSGTLVGTSPTTRVLVGARVNTTPGVFMSGTVPLALYFNRVLSPAEIKSLSDNPWQIFKPITRRIYVDIPSASGDTTLIVGDGYHDHFADNVTLTGVGGNTDLTVANCLHAHAADNVALTSQYFIAAQDATHSHTADNVTLSLAGAESLTVQDATHSHTADNVTLAVTTAIDLVVNDATHAHVADAVTLSVQSVLGISDVSHAHFADSVALSSVTSLIVADAFHTLTSTSPFFSSFTESQLAEILAYVELNMAVPTVEEIAAAIVAQLPDAVLAAAQVTPIHSDMRKTVGTTLKGDGTEADKFRSVLVD